MCESGLNPSIIKKAAKILKDGGTIIVPTDTVYEILIQAKSGKEEVISRLKQTSPKTIEIFLSKKEDVLKYAIVHSQIEKEILNKLLPGRLTLILSKKNNSFFPWEKIRIRIPADSSLRALVEEVGSPLYATSANISEKEIPEFDELKKMFKGKVDLIVKGSPLGIPSTVIRVFKEKVLVEREGALSIWEIKRILKKEIKLAENITPSVLIVCSGNTCRSPMAMGFLKNKAQWLQITTAGTVADSGTSPHPYVLEELFKRGIDISHHRSQLLKKEHLKEATLVLVMAKKHYSFIKERWKEFINKVFMFTGFPEPYPAGKDVLDPIGKGKEVHSKVAEIIETHIPIIVKEIESLKL